ncbi:MAG: Ku protein [Solirubrobacterales bacterium 67-14]|nr:MAG: Ku protein [Solirubrobacterales bacterium 67-14]
MRSIWNGTISFGLVKVPVKLYSAIDPKGIAFREIHVKDTSLLQHRRVCKQENKVVERDEVAKGYEVRPGEYVLLSNEEVKAASGERPKTIEIDEFVDVEAIDPFFFNKSYFLGVRDVEEPYALLAAALRESGKAGIGRFTFHNREYLVALRAGEDRLFLHTLRYEDEIIEPGDLDMPEGRKKPTRKEVEMARRLVAGLTEDFDPGEFQDEYRAAVMDLIERKAAGKKPRKKRVRKREKPDDLAKALEKSLAAQGS